MTYIVFAFLSALFAALTSILAKIGMKNISSNLSMALRCIVVVIFSWFMASMTTNITSQLNMLNYKTLLFLVLSGVTTGLSWMCYFHALKIGNINVVVPIDKSSIVFTIILSSFIFNETLGILKIICTLLIAIGTFMMIEKKTGISYKRKNSSIFFAFFGAIFATATSILGKIGISGIESDFGSAIRTIVVLIMAWIIVFSTGEQKKLSRIDLKSLIFTLLSGIATGASWLCYYRAISMGPVSVVAPVDKLNILFTVFFGYLFFKEKLSVKSALGLLILTTGTLLLLIC